MAPRQPLVVDQSPIHRKRNPITGYRVPDLIKNGEIVSDVTKKKWKLGKSIGVGAFGDIYLASDDISKPVGSEAKYVIKMEPHKSGPLFVEMNFYLRAATESIINNWTEKRRIKRLGMPKIYGFGSHVMKGEKMRFIVLPKYGESIYKVFLRHSQRFHIKTALTLGCYVLDVLEYIHSHGYIHSDIKALNMVLGDDAPVYLIDFGLVCKFQYRDGTHKEYTPDGRKADVGTLEFSGRDAHIGVVSRRSDLESLGYNLISWLGGKLPWEDYFDDSTVVAQLKDNAMTDVKTFLRNVFTPKQLSESSFAILEEYLDYVSRLDFNSDPDYSYCKKLFSMGIRKAGFADDSKLTFDYHAKLRKQAVKKSAGRENWVSVQKKKRAMVLGARKPCSVFNHNAISPRITRAIEKRGKKKDKNFDWASVLAGHPERDIKKEKSKDITPSRLSTPTRVEKPCLISNPTSAMLKVMERRKMRFSDSSRRSRADSCSMLNGESCTPAMEEVLASRRSNSYPTSSPRILRSSSRRRKVLK